MQTYLEPTQESGRALFMRGIPGEVVMLNLLRREVADYIAGSGRLSREPSAPKGKRVRPNYFSSFAKTVRLIVGSSSLMFSCVTTMIGTRMVFSGCLPLRWSNIACADLSPIR